jgi:hypothetical protein
MGVMLTGCASRNYDFSQATTASSHIADMTDKLNQIRHDPHTDEEELYDISVFPLVHSELHVFAEQDEADSEARYIEADIESSLPLFAFASGTVSEYDEDEQLMRRNEFESNLWGAFREERKLTVTEEGRREKTRHTIFWIFSWWGDEVWTPMTKLTASPSN